MQLQFFFFLPESILHKYSVEGYVQRASGKLRSCDPRMLCSFEGSSRNGDPQRQQLASPRVFPHSVSWRPRMVPFTNMTEDDWHWRAYDTIKLVPEQRMTTSRIW